MYKREIEANRAKYKKSAKDVKNPLRDIQKMDIGIALLYFSPVVEETGITYSGSFLTDDPGLTKDVDMEYIIFYQAR